MNLVAILSGLRQHSAVRARLVCSLLALALGGSLGLVGCDSTVVSVGSWSPLTTPTAGAGGLGQGGTAAPSPEAGAGGVEQEPEPSNSIYLEAESGELSVVAGDSEPQPSGFSIASDTTASNGQYLEPPLGNSDGMPGAARAVYRFEVAQAGDFVIWGRIYSPTATQNRFWFQLDGGTWYRWRISTGQVWYWDDFHDNLDYFSELHFQLDAGPHELVIANSVSGAKLDRLYITSLGDEPPGNDTICNPPHSIEVAGECLPSCGSLAPPGMSTTCQGCEDRPMLDDPKPYDCTVCCIAP